MKLRKVAVKIIVILCLSFFSTYSQTKCYRGTTLARNNELYSKLENINKSYRILRYKDKELNGILEYDGDNKLVFEYRIVRNRTQKSRKNTSVTINAYEYNKEGRLKRKYHFRQQPYLVIDTYNYNVKEMSILRQEYLPASNELSKIKDRVVHTRSFQDLIASEIVKKILQCPSKIIMTQELNEKGQILKSYEYKKRINSPNKDTYIVSKDYDAKGNVISEKAYSNVGEKNTRQVTYKYEYAKNSVITEVHHLKDDEKLLYDKRLKSFNDNGKIIYSSYVNCDKLKVTEYNYDENEKLIAEIDFEADYKKDVLIPSSKSKIVSKRVFSYNSKGLISKVNYKSKFKRETNRYTYEIEISEE